jgi:hypothetical protein
MSFYGYCGSLDETRLEGRLAARERNGHCQLSSCRTAGDDDGRRIRAVVVGVVPHPRHGTLRVDKHPGTPQAEACSSRSHRAILRGETT